MSDVADERDGLDIEAGEFVIGTSSAAERAAFASTLDSDDAAREAVAAWERRLADLSELVDPVAPSPQTWSRIEQALQLSEAKPLPFRVIHGGGGAMAATYLASRNRWRQATFATGALAAALLVLFAAQTAGWWPTQPTAGMMVAAVSRSGDQPALMVRVDLATRRVFVRPLSAQAPKGRSLELWYVAGGGAPRSLGVLTGDAATRLAVPSEVRTIEPAKLAVSLEPEGGSTTGGPTGPVVYSGELIAE